MVSAQPRSLSSRLPGWCLASALALLACSSSSDSAGSSPEVQQACSKLCQKRASCEQVALDCASLCASSGGNASAGASCDYQKYSSVVDECASGSCADLPSCLKRVCGGAGGADGSSGNAGNSSAAGVSGVGPDCSPCDKAHTCCLAIAQLSASDGGECDSISATLCQQQPSYLNACRSLLDTGVNLKIAACQ